MASDIIELQRHHGRFRLSLNQLLDIPTDAVRRLMGEMIIVQAQPFGTDMSIEYSAYCERFFDAIDSGAIPPEYRFTWDNAAQKWECQRLPVTGEQVVPHVPAASKEKQP